MTIDREVETWDGQTLRDSDGDKIGTITSIYLDDETGEATWMAVKFAGLRPIVSLVPLRGATASDNGVVVPYGKSVVKEAPTVEPDEEISAEDARALEEHYALASAEPGEPAPAADDDSGPVAEPAMTGDPAVDRALEDPAPPTAEAERDR